MRRNGLKRMFHLDRFGKKLTGSLDDEVDFHLETRIEEAMARGMSREQAREEVFRRFGDPDAVIHRCRRIDLMGVKRRWIGELFRDLRQDFIHALRGLRRAMGFSSVAVLSLAVAIGVNTSVFTAIQAVWFDPVPGMIDQDRIVDMVPVIRGEDYWQWAYPDFEDVMDAETPFESLAAWAEGYATVGSEEGGRRAMVGYATSEYFRVHGANPTVGRGFLASEGGGSGQHPVVVVSHHFWRDRLEARPDILGQSLLINGTPHTVIGLAPEGFRGARVNLWSLDLWVPLFQHPDASGDDSVFRSRSHTTVQVMGRLGPGATLPEGRAAVQTVFARLETEYPETNKDRKVKAVSFGRFPAQNRDLDGFAVVGICGLFMVLLLIICGNLAGMALARAAAREQEIGVRLALGSSRVRLVRHLMLEAGILTVLGGAAGIVLAMAGMTKVSPMDLNITAPGATFEPSVLTVGLSVAVSFVAAQVFGLLPALRFSRPEVVSALKDDTGGGGRRVGRLQRYSSSVQTGVSFFLLLIAALFVRSLGRADDRHLGFTQENMAVADFQTGGRFLALLDPADQGYPSSDEAGSALLDQLLESVGSLPGVASVSLATGFPLDRVRTRISVNPVDRPSPDSTGVGVEYTRATGGFFATIDTRILQGRGLLRTDDRNSIPVAVVSRSFADRLWPGEDPLGKQFSQAGVDHTPWTVVGVVAGLASSAVAENTPQVFLPLRQMRTPRFLVLIRAGPGTDTGALSGPIRDAIWAVDPGLPAPRILPAQTLVAWATQDQRTGGQVAGGLGLLVLLLAAVGVYGVVALGVANRTREIGVRIAMGATRGVVIRSVLRDALRMAGPGLVLGGILAAGTAVALRSTLLGLSPVDPIAFLSAGTVLLLVVVAASLGPALRASCIHPMEALRKD